MKTILALILYIFTPLQEQPKYSPLIPGSTWTYQTPDGTYEEHISGANFRHKNVDYLQSTRKYSDGTVEIFYYRTEKDGAIIYLDNKTFQESIEVPAKPRTSLTWTSRDSRWKYKVVAMNTDLKTPNRVFKECIAIEAESESNGGSKYINYYSKGIGFVGSKVGDELVVYLTKWTIAEKRL